MFNEVMGMVYWVVAFRYCLFSSLPRELILFDKHIFQMGGSTTS